MGKLLTPILMNITLQNDLPQLIHAAGDCNDFIFLNDYRSSFIELVTTISIILFNDLSQFIHCVSGCHLYVQVAVIS
jgi:hypothetical protein